MLSQNRKSTLTQSLEDSKTPSKIAQRLTYATWTQRLETTSKNTQRLPGDWIEPPEDTWNTFSKTRSSKTTLGASQSLPGLEDSLETAWRPWLKVLDVIEVLVVEISKNISQEKLRKDCYKIFEQIPTFATFFSLLFLYFYIFDSHHFVAEARVQMCVGNECRFRWCYFYIHALNRFSCVLRNTQSTPSYMCVLFVLYEIYISVC